MRNRAEMYTKVILTFVLVSIALLGCKAKPTQAVLATQTLPPTATATSTATASSIPSNTRNKSSNCIEILPGQYTWNAAQSIGDPSTIYDFGLYGVGYLNGEYIGTIIPGQWDVKTSTENQKKLRKKLPGAFVCGVDQK